MQIQRSLYAPIRQMPDGDKYPDDEFRFQAEISNSNLDAYYSRIGERALDQFVKDINQGGVSLQNGHRKNGMEDTWGRWISAERDGDKVIATASMLRATDSTPPHLNMDEHIRRIERGYYSDVSVGMYNMREICDICDNPIFDYTAEDRCKHWPGDEYVIDGERKTCTYEITDARLAEVSIVYDGATPGASIIPNRMNSSIELRNWKDKDADDKELSELEQIGKKYKEDLIDKLILEGVRALGNQFDEDRKRREVVNWTIESIISQTKEYEILCDLKGGRRIQDQSSGSNQSTAMPHWVFG